MITSTRFPISVCLLLFPLATLAAPPENDFWRSPTQLTGQPLAIAGNNNDATDSPGERANHGVWYQWTPDVSGAYEVSTDGSSIDTYLAVHRMNPGQFGGLQELKHNDNRDESTTDSAIRVKLFATVDYRILVASANEGETGAFKLQIASMPPPPNDYADGATLLTGDSPVILDENTPATSTEDEDGENGLWYQWVATRDGTYRVTTAGSRFFSRLTIFTGDSPDNLNEVAFSDDAPGGGSFTASIDISMTTGTRYWFLVSNSILTDSGRLQLSVAIPPQNDSVANAIPLPQASPSGSGNNQNAVTDSGNFYATHSIWYKWSPGQNGAFSVSTTGSEIDTILVAYSGPSPEELERLGINNNDPEGGTASRLDLNMIGGETYWLSVGSSDEGDFGNIKIRIDPLPAPPNDTSATPIQLDGERVVERGTVTGALTDPDESGFYGVWFTWTAPQSGPYLISTALSSFDTFLTLYTGNAPGSLSQVAFNDESPENPDRNYRGISSFTTEVSSGTRYWILVSAANELEFGRYRLNLDPVPENDTPAGAFQLTGLNPDAQDNNTGAIGGPDERGVHSIWYKWTAPMSREYTFTTEGSEFDTILNVFEGNSPDNLQEVAFNDNSEEGGISARWSSLNFAADEGVTYWIQISAQFEGQTGPVSFGIIAGVFPQTLEEWLQTELVDFGITINNGPMDDHDRDGLVHLVEYAFGLNPRGPDDPGFLRMIQSTFSDEVALVYDRRKAATAPGLVYSAEYSDDFVDWIGEDLDQSVDSVNSVWEEVSVLQPDSLGNEMRAARVLVSQQP